MGEPDWRETEPEPGDGKLALLALAILAVVAFCVSYCAARWQ